jgi:hypothetical protein
MNSLIDYYWGPGTSFLLHIQENQCLILESVVSHFNFEIFVVLSPHLDKYWNSDFKHVPTVFLYTFPNLYFTSILQLNPI